MIDKAEAMTMAIHPVIQANMDLHTIMEVTAENRSANGVEWVI